MPSPKPFGGVEEVGPERRIELRDLDKIREKVTISVEPKVLWALGLAMIGSLALSFACGYLLGRGSGEALPSQRKGGGSENAVVERPKVAAPQRVRMVFPVPALRPEEPVVALRRGIDQIHEEKREVVDLVWPSLGMTDPSKGMSCFDPDGGLCEVHGVEKRTEMATPKRQEAPPVPVARGGGGFTVQARSYLDEALALDYVKELRSRGYTCEVVTHVDETGRKWFRVRVGRFATLEGAKEFARKFNQREGAEAIVVAMEPR